MKSIIILLILVSSTLFTPTYAQWQEYTIDDSIESCYGLFVGEINGDNKLDFLATGLRKGLVWYQNDLPYWKRINITPMRATFGEIGDIDYDENLDFVACSPYEKKLVWYENNYPIWTPSLIDDNYEDSEAVKIGDINNDNKPDIVAAFTWGEGGPIIWYKNNHPVWEKDIIESRPDHHCLFLNDLDQDGLLDIITLRSFAEDIVWYKNNYSGLFWTKDTIIVNLEHGCFLTSGDINNDDTLDLVVTTGGPYRTGGEVFLYIGPNWEKTVIEADLDGASLIEIMDVNGNGRNDIIVGGFRANNLVWYENNHPEWEKHIIDDYCDRPRFIPSADIDGDHVRDLIVASMSSVNWYKNPHTKTAYAESMECNIKYMSPQQGDTLRISANLSNPDNHSVKVLSIIEGMNYGYKDSIELYDDGLHGNGIASDNILGGNKWFKGLDEDIYTVKLVTTDITDTVTHWLPSKSEFTTIGPVVFDHFKLVHVDTIANPGDFLYMKLALKNLGTEQPAENVSANISTTDTSAVAGIWSRSNSSIPCDSVVVLGGIFYISLKTDFDSSRYVQFDLDIQSNGISFWKDSFALWVVVTTIEKQESEPPFAYALMQNYPNPFNPSTTIKYAFPNSEHVKITVYNTLGQKIKTLVNRPLPIGHHQVQFNAQSMPSGVYFYRLEAGEHIQTRKMLLVR